MTDPASLEKQWRQDAEAAADVDALERLRVAILGRKGALTALLRALADMNPADRRVRGKQLNVVKQRIIGVLEKRRDILVRAGRRRMPIDVTLPVDVPPAGTVHLIRKVIEDIRAIFAQMDFSTAFGPDIEDDFHNFTALNIGPDHPARQMHDTFYLDCLDDENRPMVLRTHTSPVQIRTLLQTPPPLRIIAPGRTYRSDSDQTHTPMFHQVEGLAIGKDLHMGHLKSCIERFCRSFFAAGQMPAPESTQESTGASAPESAQESTGASAQKLAKDVHLRFRPSFFPFTEPSAEVDIGCSFEGATLRLAGSGHWMEILGCGMVHPKVLRACGVDPEQWQGFAFGMGVERLAMLKYAIGDLRTIFRCDQRLLSHYGFAAGDRIGS